MNKKYINVYSWDGADKVVEESGLYRKDINYSWTRVIKIIEYFLSRGYNTAIIQTKDYFIIWVSARGFKQY